MNNETRGGLKLTVSHHLYMFFPTQIRGLLFLQSQGYYERSNAISLMFIPAFTAFIESTLNQLLLDYISKYASSHDELTARIVDNIEETIEKATWEGYKKFFLIIFGKPIRDFVKKEVLEAIDVIYSFRNQTIHGKGISHVIIDSDEESETAYMLGRFKSISEYFLMHKLLTRQEIASITFINEKVIKHFFDNTHMFVSDLRNNIMQPHNLQLLEGYDTYVLRELKTIDISSA